MGLNSARHHNFSPLAFIVCGFEKSGTTLLNEIFRRHPGLDSGHEVGALLGVSPRNFKSHQPYFAFFMKTWRLQACELEDICDTDDWSTFYRRILELSPLILNKNVQLFDKTPIYMKYLDLVLNRVPCLPCVVSVRDPRAVMHSWANWSGHRDDPEKWLVENFHSNCERYLSYGLGYRRALINHHRYIFLNRFEDLCMDPMLVMKRIFNFLGFEFGTEFLQFESEHFVYGNSVSAKYIDEYSGVFSPKLCREILSATAEFKEWHFSYP